jgi:hypothetical protein
MPNTTKYEEPNKLDPLSEPTLNRRVWAAYLRAGFTRASFAAAMGVRYAHVHHWDLGRHVMTLPHLMRAATLVGMTLDQLAYGHAGRATPPQPELPLTDDGVRAVLFELNASEKQMTALAEHRASTVGAYQPFTRTYVTSFVSTYQEAIDAGRKHALAMRLAFVAADNARAQLAAMDAKRKPLQRSDGPLVQPMAATERKPRKRVARVPVAPPTIKH